MYNIPNYNPNYYQQQSATTGLKGRPVSSLEEVRAASVDFDGSIFYFPDLANKRIYTKQIGLDGSAILNMYELKEIPVQTPIDNSNYITREEFEMAIKQLQASLVPPQMVEEKNPQKQSIVNQF